jgi:hypothetical protein
VLLQKSQYTVWIGSIGELEDDEIKALFEDATKDAVVEITIKDGPRGPFVASPFPLPFRSLYF